MFDSSHNDAAFSLAPYPNGAAATSKLASRTYGSVPEESEHFVQFYEANEFLLDSLSDFIGLGLVSGEVCIVVATDEHRAGLDERLEASGLKKDASLPVILRLSNEYHWWRDERRPLQPHMYNTLPRYSRRELHGA